jgi:uncharacterized membrane protein
MNTIIKEQIQRHRLEALSDGVYAIILTLLVLEMKAPAIAAHHSVGALATALLHLAPKFASWVISFLMVAVIWINHHRLLGHVRHIDRTLFWLNMNLLLWTSFIPFPSGLLGDYSGNPLAVFFFGLILLLNSVAFVAMRLYIYRTPGLWPEHVSEVVAKRLLKRSIVFGPLLYAVAASLAWVSPLAAWAMYFFIPI